MKSCSSFGRVTHSSIECLENRIAPAGLVTATYLKGVLTLTGDGNANELGLTLLGADTFVLTGTGGTTIALDGAAATGTVFINGAIKDLQAKLGAGDDTLSMVGVVLGKATFDGEAGVDTLSLGDTEITGALTFLGGANNDTLGLSGSRVRVGGAFTVNLGEGDNAFNFGATSVEIGSALAVTGGAGVDLFQATDGSVTLAKGFTANLGDGANKISLELASFQSFGSLTIAHANQAAEAVTKITSNTLFSMKGGITVSYGNGNSWTEFEASTAQEITGAVKVTGGSGNDSVELGSAGTALLKGGVNLNLGEGKNTAGFGGAITVSSVVYAGGADIDQLNLSGPSARVGSVTAVFGDGSNSITMSAGDASFSGLFKVTSGAGKDNFALTFANVRFAKGITVLAGDGENDFQVVGQGNFQTGAILVDLGANALPSGENSSFSATGTAFAVTSAITVKGQGGNHAVTLGGLDASLKNVNVSLGDGSNSLALSSISTRAGLISYTGGNADDSVVFSGTELLFGGVKIVGGDGANSVTTTAGRLRLAGALDVRGGSGADVVTVLASDFQAKSAFLSLGGDSASVLVNAANLIVPGTFKVENGEQATGTTFGLNAASNLVLGPTSFSNSGTASSMTVAAGALSKIASIKYAGSAGADALTFSATGTTTTGPITFVGGEGNNGVNLSASGGKIGALQYIGGLDGDSISLNSGHSQVAGVKALLSAGSAVVSLISAGGGKFAGPVNVVAQNGLGSTASVALAQATFAGAVTVTTGAGGDNVNLSDAVFGGTVKVDTGEGSDTVFAELTSDGIDAVFMKPVTFLLGEGNDVLSIGANVPTARAIFKAAVTFNGGGGLLDDAKVSTAMFGNVYPSGQPVITGFETQS